MHTRFHLLPLVLLAVACSEPDVDVDDSDGGQEEQDLSTEAGGAGPEAGAGGSDAGPASAHDGLYLGEVIVIGSAAGYDDTSEACFGQLELTVDAAEQPPIVGIATCAFDGWLAGMGQQTLHLSGQSTGQGSASGTISVDIDGVVFEDDWSGTWEEHGLTGSFSGQTTWSVGNAEYEIGFDGSFSAWRE